MHKFALCAAVTRKSLKLSNSRSSINSFQTYFFPRGCKINYQKPLILERRESEISKCRPIRGFKVIFYFNSKIILCVPTVRKHQTQSDDILCECHTEFFYRDLKTKLQLFVDIKYLCSHIRCSIDSELRNSYKSYCTKLTKLLQNLNKTWYNKQLSVSYNKTKTIWNFLKTKTKRRGKTEDFCSAIFMTKFVVIKIFLILSINFSFQQLIKLI